MVESTASGPGGEGEQPRDHIGASGAGSGRSTLQWVGGVFVAAGVVGITIGAFLPWVYSGAAARNSFGVVRTARALGVVDSGVLRAVLVLWYFVPLLAAVTVLFLAIGRLWIAGLLAAFLGVIVVVIGLMVRTSSADLGSGPAVAAVAGAFAAVGGVLVIATAGSGTSGWERSGGST